VYGIIDKFFTNKEVDVTLPTIMRAEVVNTNDPDQMGRIQVHIVSSYSDKNLKNEFNFFAWASYASPFGGMDKTGTSGPGSIGQSKNTPYGDASTGGVAYGMWGIPKVGAHVLVCSINNDPNNLFWFACIYPDSTPHTMPHGRYSTRTPTGDTGPDGPLTSAEQPIEPLYTNLHKAFRGSKDYEWRTRGADYQVSGISAERQQDNGKVTGTESEIHDTEQQTLIEDNNNTLGQDLKYRQGYSLSRSDPTKTTDDKFHVDRYMDTDNNLESSVLSFTTPGFNAISLDDRPENNRIRLRSSTGHQIIMDDTNERIYVSTSEGRNWIEMDADGHIYVYSQESISLRAEGDLNFTAGKSIRMTAATGIHVESQDEIRLHATKDLHIRTEQQLFTLSEQDMHLQSSGTIHTKAASAYHIESIADFTIKGSNMVLDSGGNVKFNATLKASGDIESGGDIATSSNSLDGHEHNYTQHVSGIGEVPKVTLSHSGGSVTTSTSPVLWGGLDPELAFWTNITPKHEPWARTFIKDPDTNLTHSAELEYDDPDVGRNMKRVVDLDRTRGPLWHR